MEKIKVVWICHFSNLQIREKIPLSKLKFSNALRRILGKQEIMYADFAPWITNLIKEFENFNDVELHVVAPHYGLTKVTSEFEKNGIFYHFFKPDGSSVISKLRKKLFKQNNPEYKSNRKLVQRFIKTIKPDIVNLIGTENPYYSITSLEIDDIPVYVSAQTVYSNPERIKYSGAIDQYIWDTELKIHQKECYFGCGGRIHRDLILKNNPNAVIFKMFFPIEKPSQAKEVPKVFDFVFFAAGVTKKKGIEDAIDALSLVKKEKSDVTLNVVGSCAQDYKIELLKKISDLNLEKNITFNGYFPVHADMHQHIKKARFALLPNKLDVISGTVIEAILLGLPLVTYKTTGAPYLNKDGETVLLADIGDIQKLAESMLLLIKKPELGEKLKHDAKCFVEKEFNNTASAKRLADNYRSVVNHFNLNIPIPDDQLFNIDEFPIY